MAETRAAQPVTFAATECQACAPAAQERNAVSADLLAEQELAAFCKALAHPTRIRILKILMARIACVCGDIVDELPIAQSTVSEHLLVLKQVGLVQGEVDGPRVCYCIDPERLARAKALFAWL